MKWLVTTFLCVLAMPVFADNHLIRLPAVLWCGPYEQNLSDLETKYGEIPFVHGDGEVMTPDPTMSYQGKVRIFLDPKDFSYSVFLDIDERFTCLLTTGENLEPSISGDPT